MHALRTKNRGIALLFLFLSIHSAPLFIFHRPRSPRRLATQQQQGIIQRPIQHVPQEEVGCFCTNRHLGKLLGYSRLCLASQRVVATARFQLTADSCSRPCESQRTSTCAGLLCGATSAQRSIGQDTRVVVGRVQARLARKCYNIATKQNRFSQLGLHLPRFF